MKDLTQGKVLIVGGATEALALARRVPGATVLLPEAERVARDWAGPVHRGALAPAWLRDRGIAAVIEAAHPCDSATAAMVAAASRAAGVPHLQLVRPEWRPGPRDTWVPVRDVAQVVAVVPPTARLFVTVGRAELPGLRAFHGEVFARVIGRKTGVFALRRGRFVAGVGPFSVAQEVALLRRLRIDWLVLRNAGGPGGWPKLAAARQLGVPVVMVARPRRPAGPRVATIEEALKWLSKRQILAV
ncbi:precorrin-6A/cobalt-precorrin-6A reductase [Puniceibacterium sediminis]|uniref:Precorrin-6A/cobalt-precorrin-6A reductase n=1 Tax=Puniceibacterium sediminis TaxID=1608407 RepID=A0A238W5J4_9RHOB|nr:precorrin-6A/cobalt-precorrin-6A reductase [Puniceibacterium sediminis]SNR41687.1 precorrin-6A/cobalt-precorrin-6A reductase [Puniceibacterium sediminis]